MAKQRRPPMVPRLNLTDLAEAMSRPGSDTREWFSYGTVRGGTTEDDPCVFFDRDQPLVRVLLHPGLVECVCRVGTPFAGDGEGEYSPFVPGDEVCVALPEGTPRAGGVVLCRLNNEIDKFPSGSVAGQDPRKNAFAFRRRKTPLVEEHNGPLMTRSALTGGFISIDDAGVLTLRAGNPDDPTAAQPAPGLQMGPDGVSLQDATAKYALSLGPTSGALLVLVGDAVLALSSSDGNGTSQIGVPGALALATAGNAPLEHAASAESTVSLLVALLNVIAAGFSLIPPSVGGAPGGAPFAAILSALTASGLSTVIPLAGTLTPQSLAAIVGKIQTQGAKPNTPGGQLSPGIGSPGLLIG